MEQHEIQEQERALRAQLGARWRDAEPLARHCTLRVGGPARHWLEIETILELFGAHFWADAAGLPVVLAGLGSNTLFPDEGIDGVVLRLAGDYASVGEPEVAPDDPDARLVRIGGGAINAHVVRRLLGAGLVGMEFLSLIPGTFGGSVVMNAGTREQELSSILTHATLLVPHTSEHLPDGWRLIKLSAAELELRYRHATLPPRAVVLDGTIRVRPGDTEAARGRVKDDKERRNRTQPYRLASVGSTFANPPGDYAGRLIDALGLKGFSVGGAQISPLHANFFINHEGATAADFLGLMAHARVHVRRAFGVELRPEVRFVGFDGWARLRELESALEAELDASDAVDGPTTEGEAAPEAPSSNRSTESTESTEKER